MLSQSIAESAYALLALLTAFPADCRHVLAAAIAAAMTALTTFAAGLACLLGSEFMCRPTFMRSLAAFAAGDACFFRSEFVRGAFLVRGMAAHAGDLALLLWIHGSEAAVARAVLVALAAGLCMLFTGSTAGILIGSHIKSLSLMNEPPNLPLLLPGGRNVKQRGAILATTVVVAYQRLSELFVGQ